MIDDDNATDHAIFGHHSIPFDITFKSSTYIGTTIAFASVGKALYMELIVTCSGRGV